MKKILCLGLLLCSLSLFAELSLIEVHLKIENGDFGEVIQKVRFNDEDVILNDSKKYFPRRLATFHTASKFQTVEWTTVSKGLEDERSTETGHKKVFSVDEGDDFVRVIIKGHNIWVK